MGKRRGVWFAVVLAASAGAIASPAAAAKATVPGAPTITTVTPGTRSVVVAFTAPADNGGARISGYRVACTPSSGREVKYRLPARVADPRDRPVGAHGVLVHRFAARNRVGAGPVSAPVGVEDRPRHRVRAGERHRDVLAAAPQAGTKSAVIPGVDTVLMTNGTIGNCIGGGVTGGTTALVSSTIVGASCSTFAAGTQGPFHATLTITWNTNATSTVALQIQAPRGRATSPKLSGTVTDGLFKGLRETATLGFNIGKTGCTSADLSTLPYKQLVSTVIA